MWLGYQKYDVINNAISSTLFFIVARIETKSGLIKQRYVKCLLCLPHKTT